MIIIGEWVLLGRFVICLIRATVEDLRFKKVHRRIWWDAGIAGGGMIALGILSFRWKEKGLIIGCPGAHWLEILPYGISTGKYGEMILDLVCFGLLQRFLFARMYGRADAYAFSMCSLVWASFGGGLREDLIHMLVSVILLGLVQAIKRNVASSGNLKKPVAFVPYISAGFLVCLLGAIRGIL